MLRYLLLSLEWMPWHDGYLTCLFLSNFYMFCFGYVSSNKLEWGSEWQTSTHMLKCSWIFELSVIWMVIWIADNFSAMPGRNWASPHFLKRKLILGSLVIIFDGYCLSSINSHFQALNSSNFGKLLWTLSAWTNAFKMDTLSSGPCLDKLARNRLKQNLYSGDLNSQHLNSGNIWIANF